MPTEVILKEHVEHLGRRGEIVKVAPGYARNYLLPRKLALAVTGENKKQIERERVKAEALEVEELHKAQAFARKLEGVEVVIARRVGEHDTLFGSVTSSDIAEALAARDLTVDKRRIQLVDAIKMVGEHPVAIKLFRDVTATVKVRIVPAD
jgi:large subunit ribosomal protein L9